MRIDVSSIALLTIAIEPRLSANRPLGLNLIVHTAPCGVKPP